MHHSLTAQLTAAYDRLILGRPVLTLLVTTLVVFALGYHAKDFRLDASADTLILENDKSLEYYRSIKARYGSDDSLVITYTPSGDLFSDEVLSELRQLRDELLKIERVESVVSLLDVPLINSPPVTLSDLSREIITLEHPRVDRAAAREELLSSQLYRNLLISPDGETTALQLSFKRDDTWHRLLKVRDTLRKKQLQGLLTPQESASLDAASQQFETYKVSLQAQEAADIAAVRSSMAQHSKLAKLHLGGVPMITVDSIDFVRHDLITFGLGVLAFLILILIGIFGRLRWVFLSILTCIFAGVSMIGLLGLLDWPVTVVSSNFISLLLILTLSLSPASRRRSYLQLRSYGILRHGLSPC